MENVDQNQTSDKTVLFTFQFASCKSNTDNRLHLLVLKYIYILAIVDSLILSF